MAYKHWTTGFEEASTNNAEVQSRRALILESWGETNAKYGDVMRRFAGTKGESDGK